MIVAIAKKEHNDRPAKRKLMLWAIIGKRHIQQRKKEDGRRGRLDIFDFVFVFD